MPPTLDVLQAVQDFAKVLARRNAQLDARAAVLAVAGHHVLHHAQRGAETAVRILASIIAIILARPRVTRVVLIVAWLIAAAAVSLVAKVRALALRLEQLQHNTI